jgi:hypothetical protein
MHSLSFRPSVILAIACIAATAACGSDSSSSTPPAPTPQATLASVQVTGTAPIVPGTAQFTATAVMTDSSSSNVTSQAFWSSSNIAIASVSNTGVVTALSQGDAVITAVYQNITGRLSITIAKALPYTVSGVVTDATSGAPIVNAGVAATDSSLAPITVLTNGSGAYTIANVLAGPVAVSAGATGYINKTQQITLSANTTVNIQLQRAF